MKKLNDAYEAPCLKVAEMQLEQCILTSSYGDYGDPGQDSDYNDYEDYL